MWMWLFEFPFVVIFVISRLSFSLWGPMEATFSSWTLSSGLIRAHKLRASNSKHMGSCFHHLQTLFVEGSLVRQLYLLFFLLLTHTFCRFRCIEPFPYCSISESDCLIFHIGIWLFDFSFVVIFVLSRFCLSVNGVLWKPCSHRGSCQVGWIVPASLELPIWSIKTVVPIICNLSLCKATLSDNLVYSFKSFWLASWGGRKLETFADNHERQRWKSYRRIFAKIVAIWSPPLFF